MVFILWIFVCTMSTDTKDQMEKAKNVRRAAKKNLLDLLKLNVLRNAEQPIQEIQEALEETKDAYKALVAKHDDHTMFLNDDAEAWLNE